MDIHLLKQLVLEYQLVLFNRLYGLARVAEREMAYRLAERIGQLNFSINAVGDGAECPYLVGKQNQVVIGAHDQLAVNHVVHEVLPVVEGIEGNQVLIKDVCGNQHFGIEIMFGEGGINSRALFVSVHMILLQMLVWSDESGSL